MQDADNVPEPFPQKVTALDVGQLMGENSRQLLFRQLYSGRPVKLS